MQKVALMIHRGFHLQTLKLIYHEIPFHTAITLGTRIRFL